MNIEPVGDNKSLDVDGLKVDMSVAIGDFFVKKLMAEMTEPDFKKLYDAILSDVFTCSDYELDHCKTEKERKEYIEKFGMLGKVKEDRTDRWGNVEEYSLAGYARKRFDEKFKDDIIKRINEIMNTEDYQSRVDKVAHEILDYATEGWKNDAINRIRCAMIDDRLNGGFYGVSLRSIIQEEISKFSRNY